MYQYFADEFHKSEGLYYDLTIPREKRRLKDEFFRILYSDNRFIMQENAVYKRLFKRLFPTVYRIFNLIKQKGNHHLPIILQLVESEVILKRVGIQLHKTDPQLPLFTIHDSMVTLRGSENLVHQQLKMEFESIIGLQPSLAIEPWVIK